MDSVFKCMLLESSDIPSGIKRAVNSGRLLDISDDDTGYEHKYKLPSYPYIIIMRKRVAGVDDVAMFDIVDTDHNRIFITDSEKGLMKWLKKLDQASS